MERRRTGRTKMAHYFAEYSRPSFWSYFRRPQGTRAHLFDVGKGGVQMLTREPLEVRKDYTVAIEAKSLAEPFHTRGEVVWCKPVQGQNLYRIGVRFKKPSSHLLQSVTQLLEENRVNASMARMSRRGN